MNPCRKIWIELYAPAAAVGLTAASVLGGCGAGWVSAASALLVSMTTAAGINALVCRRIATIRKRMVSTSGQSQTTDALRAAARELGPVRELFDEAVNLIARHEGSVEQSAMCRTELEARMNVRHKQARRLEAVFNSLTDAVVVVDNLDKVSFWNRAAVRLFGSLAGKSDVDSAVLVQPPELSLFPGLREFIATTRSRAGASTTRTQESDITVGNTARSFQIIATNVQEDDGPSQGVAVILRDIAREKEVKERHAEFLSSATHELKTPLSGIKAFLEMLIDGDIEERDEQLKLFGFMDVQIDRLTRLINNMLNLARIESGVIKVQREDLGLNEVLEKALDVVRPLAAEKNITIDPQLSDLYLPVHVDRDLFGQATINLLSNAIKYTPEGGTVRLRSRNIDGEAVMEVRDTGMGIPAADLGKIFERFYRVAQNNKAAAGTGLGLALVHYIVTQVHSGKISVESEVHEGSCFTVSIPLGHRHSHRRKSAESNLCTV